jgi:hypothetical protein
LWGGRSDVLSIDLQIQLDAASDHESAIELTPVLVEEMVVMSGEETAPESATKLASLKLERAWEVVSD